jgi:hypothetical protein
MPIGGAENVTTASATAVGGSDSVVGLTYVNR